MLFPIVFMIFAADIINGEQNHIYQLIDALFMNYSSNIRPKENLNFPTNVSMTFQVQQLLEVVLWYEKLVKNSTNLLILYLFQNHLYRTVSVIAWLGLVSLCF